ncbi:MAG TPA: hypothetical protein VN750_15685 [Steroidobacteraceae bacterium]|nr:hypothetical protein [Steroidobacteraceae bacterium]
MRVELSAYFAALIGVICGCSAAAADDSSRATEDALRAYREFQVCAAQSDGGRRLACYDKAMKRPDSSPTPEQRFGLTPGQVLEKQHLESPPKEVTSQVVAVGRTGQGTVRLTLANGQVWAAQSPSEPDLLLEVGDTVTVSRAALGSFLLSASRTGNRSMRVNRLK